MTIHFRTRNHKLTVLGLLSAIGVGLFTATLPLSFTGAVLFLGTFAVVAAITPLAVLVVMPILAPLRTLMATESAVQLPIDIGQASLGALLIVWGIHRIARRKSLFRPRWTSVFVPLFMFVSASSLSIFNAISLGAWLSEWLKWIQILVIVALILDLAQQNLWEWLLFGLVCSGAANTIVGIYEFLGGSGAEHLLINERFFRAFGTFGQPNPFGGFMGILAPLALMAAFGYAVRWWRRFRSTRHVFNSHLITVLFYTGASALIIIGLVISWSRGAWLGFVIACAAMAFALPRRIWQSFALVLTVAVLVGILWFANLLPASVTNRIASSTEEFFAIEDVRGVDITPENYAVVERLAHWQAANNMIHTHPWFGVGLGNYEVVYDNYRLVNWHEPLGHAHNYYLNIWAEAGIIGFAAYGILWVGVVWLTWKTRRHPDHLARSLAVGLLGTWVYLSVHSVLDNLYVNNLFLHIGMMLGILAILHNQVFKAVLMERV